MLVPKQIRKRTKTNKKQKQDISNRADCQSYEEEEKKKEKKRERKQNKTQTAIIYIGG